MKYLVVSDIHGSRYYAEKLEKIIEKECSDKIILLGDLYYHGPRNPLPRDYEPKEVAEILNKYKDEILAVRGKKSMERNSFLHTDTNTILIFGQTKNLMSLCMDIFIQDLLQQKMVNFLQALAQLLVKMIIKKLVI